MENYNDNVGPKIEMYKRKENEMVEIALTVRIKAMITIAPAKFWRKWRNKVKYNPRYNNHVINGDKCNDS